MDSTSFSLPGHYRAAVRSLLRYALVMTLVGLLAGLAFQESARKLTFAAVGAGLHLEGIFQLALVHGHVFMLGVLMPLALAGSLFMARRIGGSELSPRALAWLVRGYLPAAALTVALQLYKGYHMLLAVRGGAVDLASVDAAFMGGSAALRAASYGIIHTAMGVCLIVFLTAMWRSLAGAGSVRP